MDVYIYKNKYQHIVLITCLYIHVYIYFLRFRVQTTFDKLTHSKLLNNHYTHIFYSYIVRVRTLLFSFLE